MNKFRYYIPTHEMPFFSGLMKIFYKGGLFIECVFVKYLRVVDHQIPTKVDESTAMTKFARKTYLVKYYNEDLTFFHSIKFSQFIKNKNERYKFCSTVVKSYHKVLFLNSSFANGINNTIFETPTV
ncbi:hypothetical protein WR25_06914 isoform B [Diploscapter pachys]|uniref:Uncharacterized protein n=1 Tax=Diploscapter pachys TaxID=2018661 RepID=A0A2A2KZ52_9BILA|nr:hypothetical protein WR25_06914 isoform B [Diploscapter pachys]